MLHRIRIAVLIAFAAFTAACLDEVATEPTQRLFPAPAEDKTCEAIRVDNESGVDIGITIKYKDSDGKQTLVTAFVVKGEYILIHKPFEKLEVVSVTVSGGGNTYVAKDGGIVKKNDVRTHKWSIAKKDNFTSQLVPDVVACGGPAPYWETDVEGDPIAIESEPATCTPCFCPDPAPPIEPPTV
jgi:hypothetical protein